MNPTLRMPLSRAESIARKLAEKMHPHCAQIVIAGSIRRARPTVGDIDLVILPKSPAEKLLLTNRCRALWAPVLEGPQNCIYQMPISNGHIQVDIFFARGRTQDLFSSTPSNFGSLLLCRTGSKEHNIKLVEYAKRQGLRWHPYEGVYDAAGHLVASATEEEILAALGLPYIPPTQRDS
jgi:DNA polymerase (family X)